MVLRGFKEFWGCLILGYFGGGDLVVFRGFEWGGFGGNIGVNLGDFGVVLCGFGDFGGEFGGFRVFLGGYLWELGFFGGIWGFWGGMLPWFPLWVVQLRGEKE